MTKKPQNTISQNALKHYNQFISVRPESLRLLQITKDARDKIRFETESK